MLAQIISLIVDTLGSLFVYLLLLRFHMQWTRAPFRNPVGEMIAGLTNWLVLPARRVIPGLLGLDMATLLLAWLAQSLITALLMSLQGHDFGNPGVAVLILASIMTGRLITGHGGSAGLPLSACSWRVSRWAALCVNFWQAH